MALDYDINEQQEVPGAWKPSAASGYKPKADGQPNSTGLRDEPDSGDQQTQVGQLFAKVNERTRDREKAKQAAFGSLSALKIISNVLGGLIHHADGLTEDEIEQRSNEILQHYAEQSRKLHAKLNLPEERYVYESITGSLARLISQHYRAVGPKALEMDWASALENINQLDGIWAQQQIPDSFGSLESRRSMAMMNALAPVVSAYQRFNYFHPESQPVLQRLGDLMWQSVDGALQDNPTVRDLAQDEREMLRKNLLFRAGELMADSWQAHVRGTVSLLREMPPAQRRDMTTNGFPLDQVERTFQSQFQMLRQTLDISLSVHTGLNANGQDQEPELFDRPNL